jgi:cob(I)alamin adenosyltransferase
MPRHPRENPVVLSRIYTRTGDDGTTALGDGSRAAKTDPRLAAYADVDEANCAIGAAVTMGGLPADIASLLVRLQNELFDVGADLCNPLSAVPPAAGQPPPLRIDEAYITRLEEACDAYNEGLPTLRSFVLPGGSAGAVLLHTARTVVRRAERSAWAAAEAHGQTVSVLPARYLNRLSDLLFILARRANEPGGDLLWRPGGQR